MKRIISVLLLLVFTITVSACGSEEKLTNVFAPDLFASFEAVDVYRDSISYYDGAFYMLYHRYGTGMFLREVDADGNVTDRLLSADDSGRTVQNAVHDSEGNLLCLFFVYTAGSESGGYRLTKQDGDSIIFETELEIDGDRTMLYCGDDGSSYIASGDRLTCCDSSGKVLYSETLDGEIIALGGSGAARVAFETEDGIFISEISASGVHTGSVTELPLPPDEVSRVLFGGGYKCYIDTDGMLYGLDNDNALVDILSWNNSCIAQNSAERVIAMNEAEFVYFRYNPGINNEQFVRLTKVPDDEVVPKTKITFAVLKNVSGLTEMINSFNQTNGVYFIEVLDYSPATRDPQIVEKLKIELAAGNTPDLVQVTDRFDPYSLAGAGAFADLYAFIERDAQISTADFMDGILPVFEHDGKLIMLPYAFSVETLTAKASNIAFDTWTADGFFDFADKNSRSMMIFTNRRDMVDMLCRSNIGTIEKETSLKAGGLLAEILGYTAGIGKDYPIAYMDEDERAAYDADEYRMYREDEVLLWSSPIASYFDYMKLKGAFDCAELNHVGYPVAEGGGTYLNCQFGIAMSSRSENQSGAWELMRTLLNDDFLSDIIYFPTTKSGFEAYTENAAELHYYIDSSSKLFASPDENLDAAVYSELPFTDADIDRIRELISGATLYPMDMQPTAIIWEEAAMYYDGARGLDDTVGIINARLRNYFAERR